MTRTPRALALLLALATSCGGKSATLSFELVFPAGVDRLPVEATTARLTLDGDPPTVVEGAIAADGSFSLALEVPADGTTSAVTFEALDAGGTVLVRGHSPPLPLALYQDTLRLFVAPPGRFAEARVALDPARSRIAVAPLSYGFLVAGGADGAGEPLDALAVYSIYFHELIAGEDLPEARAGLVAAAGDFGIIYLLGGDGPLGPSGDIFRFDTNAAPDGDYTTIDAVLPSIGGEAAGLGNDAFVVTVPGDVSRLLDAAAGTVAELDAATLGAESATTTLSGDGHLVVIVVGPDGGALIDATDGSTTALDLGPGADAARSGHIAVRLPDNDVLAIGGTGAGSGAGLASGLRITPTGTATDALFLAVPRRAPAAAVTGDLLVVAGGFDQIGQPLASAELFDAGTLAPLGMIPLVAARGGAHALTLANGDIVLLGGTDAETGGAPVGAVEFLTP